MTGLIIVAIIVVLLLIIAFWAIGTYNKLVRLRTNAQEGFSTMDIYLKKRYDLIPNLVETVKGYAKHESETLEKVISARNIAMGASTPEEKLEADNHLTGTLKSLFAVAESYPDLKANTNFMSLQSELSKVEEDIANSRKYYNGTVKMLNNAIMMVPSNIIAGLFNFKTMPLYQVNDTAERENVKVQF